MTPPPQQPQELPMMQKLEQWEWLIWLPALSVAVMLRKDIGLRMLHRGYITGVSGIMFIISLYTPPKEGPIPLGIHAILVFMCGFIFMFKRWWEFSRHKKQHSYYLGTSPFAYRFLPDYFRQKRIMERLFDPCLCFVGGALIISVSQVWGLWLMFAGICLMGAEGAAYKKIRQIRMDMIDSLVFSEYQGETVERFETAPASQNRQPSKAPIATGLGNDIARKIAEKRRNQ